MFCRGVDDFLGTGMTRTHPLRFNRLAVFQVAVKASGNGFPVKIVDYRYVTALHCGEHNAVPDNRAQPALKISGQSGGT